MNYWNSGAQALEMVAAFKEPWTLAEIYLKRLQFNKKLNVLGERRGPPRHSQPDG
jgi:hypothetical protein